MATHELGGGSRDPVTIKTHGMMRMSVSGGDAHFEFTCATDDAPARANRGAFFFRRDETNKMQCCVQFPSGVVQVLATEP